MDPVRTIQVNTAPAYEVRIFEPAAISSSVAGSQVNPFLPAKQAAEEVAAFLGAKPNAAPDAHGAAPDQQAALPRVFVLTDETVDALYGDTFMDSLGPLRESAVRMVVPAKVSRSYDLSHPTGPQ